jgi:hypothetical protein
MSGSPLRHPDSSLKLDVTRPPERKYVCQFLARGMVPEKTAASMLNFSAFFARAEPLEGAGVCYRGIGQADKMQARFSSFRESAW